MSLNGTIKNVAAWIITFFLTIFMAIGAYLAGMVIDHEKRLSVLESIQGDVKEIKEMLRDR